MSSISGLNFRGSRSSFTVNSSTLSNSARKNNGHKTDLIAFDNRAMGRTLFENMMSAARHAALAVWTFGDRGISEFGLDMKHVLGMTQNRRDLLDRTIHVGVDVVSQSVNRVIIISRPLRDMTVRVTCVMLLSLPDKVVGFDTAPEPVTNSTASKFEDDSFSNAFMLKVFLVSLGVGFTFTCGLSLYCTKDIRQQRVLARRERRQLRRAARQGLVPLRDMNVRFNQDPPDPANIEHDI